MAHRGHTQRTQGSRTQQQHCSSNRCWSCRNPAAPRRPPAPIKAQTTKLLGKLTPSRSSGTHEGEHAGTRSRACDRVCCAAGPTARTTLSCLSSELCTGAFGGAKGVGLLLDGDESQGDRVHPPPMPRWRRRGKSSSGGRAGTGALSEADHGMGSNRREYSLRQWRWGRKSKDSCRTRAHATRWQ